MIRAAKSRFLASRACLRPFATGGELAYLVPALLLAVLLAGCGSGTDDGGRDSAAGSNQDAGQLADSNPPGTTIAAMSATASNLSGDVAVTDFIVVGSSRTGRTTMRYELRLKLSNNAAQAYQQVVATLLAVPDHIAIINPSVTVGNLPANSTILSSGTFTIDVDLAISTSFDDFVWQIDGDVGSPPTAPPTGKPTRAGYFMNIDGSRIKGESSSESHRDWIELISVSNGLQLTGDPLASAGRSRSSFEFAGVTVSKYFDLSTPELRRAITDGTIFGEVRIEYIRGCGGNLYTALAITLTTARLETLSAQAVADQQPTEELGFDYSRIETMFTPVDSVCKLLPPLYTTQDGRQLAL